MYYYCERSDCVRILNQNKICTLAQRGQERQAEKILSDTARYLPVATIGDNIRVAIPKVDRGKLGDKHILGVITDQSGIHFYNWDKRRYTEPKIHER